MNVTLLTSTDSFTDMERFAALAALTCHANTEKKFIPADVLRRIIKAGHESVLEHINLTYSIKGLTRACLQELARHRHISLSVESTRHTLKKQLAGNYESSLDFFEDKPLPISTFRGITSLPLALLELLKEAFIFNADMSNDELKYYLPEFWPTNLILTSNIRELRHIITLRSAPAALKEFQDLARELFNVVPEQFKYLLQDCVYQEAQE